MLTRSLAAAALLALAAVALPPPAAVASGACVNLVPSPSEAEASPTRFARSGSCAVARGGGPERFAGAARFAGPARFAGVALIRASWLRPVPGAVVRAFAVGGSPFLRGQHRGVDLRAPPGTPVRSACSGRVVFTGRVPERGRAVTVRCGEWRVTYLQLSAVAVRRGAVVRRGARIGRSGAPPGGRPHLHVGVRREGSAFAYVDPLAFFGSGGAPARPLVPVARPTRRLPRLTRPRRAPRAAPARGPARLPLAPWPAWVGTALLLAGAWPAARGRLVRRDRREQGSAQPRAERG